MAIKHIAIGGISTECSSYSPLEAIEIANDTPYGLTNYVQTQDPARAKRMSKKLLSGTVELNGKGAASGAPFGGFKHSGIGREGGEHGFNEYIEVKVVTGWN